MEVTFHPREANLIERKPLPDPISSALSIPPTGVGIESMRRSVSSLGGYTVLGTKRSMSLKRRGAKSGPLIWPAFILLPLSRFITLGNVDKHH